MKIHEHLKVRLAEPNEALPKLNPSIMSFWRREGDRYAEYPVNLMPIAYDGDTFNKGDVQEDDYVSFGNVLFKPTDFMDRLAEAGFLKLRALGKPFAYLQI